MRRCLVGGRGVVPLVVGLATDGMLPGVARVLYERDKLGPEKIWLGATGAIG